MAEVDLSDAEKVYIIHGVQVLYLFQLMCFLTSQIMRCSYF